MAGNLLFAGKVFTFWERESGVSVPVVCRSVLKINTMHCVATKTRETGDWDMFRARGKLRGFSPGAAARLSHHAIASRTVLEFFVFLVEVCHDETFRASVVEVWHDECNCCVPICAQN